MHKRKCEIIKYDSRSMLFKNKKGKLTCEQSFRKTQHKKQTFNENKRAAIG